MERLGGAGAEKRSKGNPEENDGTGAWAGVAAEGIEEEGGGGSSAKASKEINDGSGAGGAVNDLV